MKSSRIVRAAQVGFLCALLAACASGPPHPAGWTAGQGQTWTQGDQRYTVSFTAFGGTMKDLASQQTIDMILRSHGTKFKRSDPYPDCPGLGALLTFNAPAVTTLQGLTIRDSTATVVTYARPPSAAPDAAAMAAMKQTVCHTTI
jgi:hypothetical protein